MNFRQIFFFSFVTLLVSVSAKKDRIRLKDVEALTLYSDRWTTSRRSSPVKQLNCIGGQCSRVPIDTVQCYNRGFDGNDVQWECKAELPSNYKFGRLEVSCEGFDYPDDDYILAGSCGLEYTIVDASKASNSYFPSAFANANVSDDGGSGSSMLTIVVVFVACVALYFYLRPSDTNEQRNDAGNNRSWFNSNPSAPPPPPGFRPDCYNNTSSSSSSSSTGTSNRPGFFSGMAAGSFLGYMFGSNRGNRGYNNYRQNPFANDRHSSSYSSYGGGLGGSQSNAGGRSGTSTSTGFATTKRR